ncbi:hypothetical protein COB55_05660 [Candidatus Wolfebacteria bacterium]|nr:MAG: hypothetical protein COB55_05660 [Candidatus Wolfebacteria bacterium]
MNFSKDILPILGLFALMWFVWFFAGGPTRSANTEGSGLFSFSMPTFVIPNIRHATYTPRQPAAATEPDTHTDDIPTNGSVSPYAQDVSISTVQRTSRGDPSREYVRLRVDRRASARIVMTGWRLVSLSSGASVQIGQVSQLPYVGRSGNGDNLSADPGDVIIISSGRSPIGLSFETNVCTGYFEQHQDFIPRLPQKCPLPEDETIPKRPNQFNDSCLDYIERIPRCSTPTNVPFDLQSTCRKYVLEEVNYNSCLVKHKNDDNFYTGEWRVFLNREDTLWKRKREVIQLLDREGRVVSTYSY